ncbi:MAG: cytochrome c5 family protein [Rubrivivax sp.]|nr:MAG: cytochrome c5 family protein [Rubrivivax sp.]
MSQEPLTHDEGPIRTPKQLIVAVVLAFIVPIAIIVLLVSYVSSTSKESAGSDALQAEAVAKRIMPVATVQVKAAAAVAGAATGEDVYKGQCAACHEAGTLGAPKLGDAAAWGPRIAQGLETLWDHAMKGKGAMPPQAGGDFNGDEIKRAVAYLANSGGAKFTAPAPAAASAASGADAAAPTPVADAASAPAPVTAATTPSPAPAPAAATTTAAAPVAVPALYTANCFACHGTGVMNAPKLGDKAAWAPRLAAGVDVLTSHAIKGKGLMPPKGGAVNASDADIKAVVTYMVSQVK